jgi:uncharacterized membrane protein YoaK (UPF0700 family)
MSISHDTYASIGFAVLWTLYYIPILFYYLFVLAAGLGNKWARRRVVSGKSLTHTLLVLVCGLVPFLNLFLVVDFCSLYLRDKEYGIDTSF